MKKLVILLSICILGAFGFAYKTLSDHRSAQVDQMQGVNVFVNSEPIDEFEYLGTVKSEMSFGSTQFSDVRDRLLKKLKKEFPTADGAIFRFKTGAADQADAIRFK